jgi:hypothetical protein
MLLLTSILSIDAASACSPASYSPQELTSNRDIGFVKGYVRWNDRTDDQLIFVVEESLRGNFPKGEYRLVEGGAWGDMCEYGEVPVTYPRSIDPHPNDGTVYLPIHNMHDGVLVTSFGWSRGIGVENGYVTSRSYDVQILESAFEKRLQRRFHLGLADWKNIPEEASVPAVQ